MSLVELMAQADERGLAAGGLACLDRCVPLLGGDDEVLRPLWAGLVDDGEEWGERVAKIRGELSPAGGPEPDSDGSGDEEVALLARRMLDAVPEQRNGDGLREWAEVCSVSALRIHQLLDPLDTGGDDSVAACREGRTEGASHLVAAELRRQIVVLELLAQHGAAGLRQALGVATEGRRVLRAVVSRRARGARR
ncbi:MULTISPECIES: hypothetical protein [unclassified Streptomyces]|uniref:hypothetical protein n=1 Tax=unclassified Streptomyces TaxID=2593676 RepID=UPI002E79309B|nr:MULTISPECIES: hypothetical protein [unclassified Streptomyces]MEE1759001.1 hypothetical protein [Streptomyces sp. SP18BB07]MEE1833922.1 hypothetical protein [Streptomyces sp. SP17KL33]